MTACPTCGIKFTPTTANPTYCTPACRPQVRADRAAAPSKATRPKRRTRSERFADLNAFVDMGIADLTGAETKVWLILFRDTKANGTARTGQADIARRSGMSRRGVQVALDKLRTKGMVKVVHRGQLNAGPSAYRVIPTAV